MGNHPLFSRAWMTVPQFIQMISQALSVLAHQKEKTTYFSYLDEDGNETILNFKDIVHAYCQLDTATVHFTKGSWRHSLEMSVEDFHVLVRPHLINEEG